MCRSASQGGRRCSGRGIRLATQHREEWSPDIRYEMSEQGPEADHAEQIDRRANEIADRWAAENEAAIREQRRGW